MNDYKEIPSPMAPNPALIVNKAYRKGDLRILVTRERHGDRFGGWLRWHLSISCADRYPLWDEIRDARYALLPDNCTMGMLLPPKKEYVNLHPNCFHLHEVLD